MAHGVRRGTIATTLSVVMALVGMLGMVGAAAVTAAAVVAEPGSGAAANPFPNGKVEIKGHGWGPGIGMGQWGAFGDAAVDHETYQWILGHFYGGTTLATTDDPKISVAIIENVGAPVIVTSPTAFHFGGSLFSAGTAAKAVLTANGLWRISSSSSCSGSTWNVVKKDLTNPTAKPLSQRYDAPIADLLTLCRADGVHETMRGVIHAFDDSGSPRTVNRLPLDQYVTDVVPSESSAGWGEVGGAGPQGEQWGFQELEAQAVAARTYALAYQQLGGWSGYADICDSDDCQTYPGVVNESSVATAAVADTAEEYLEQSGRPATTQFSASTGGYTSGIGFPAVADAGDSVCLKNTGLWTCNADHTWTTSIPVSSVEAEFPQVGTLRAIRVTSRNNLGAWHGRVLTIDISGRRGSVSEPGNMFQGQFNLMSNWFIIRHPKPTSPTTSTTTTPATPASSTTRTTAPSETSHLSSTGTGPLP